MSKDINNNCRAKGHVGLAIPDSKGGALGGAKGHVGLAILESKGGALGGSVRHIGHERQGWEGLGGHIRTGNLIYNAFTGVIYLTMK